MITVALFNSLVVLCAYLARYKGYEFFLKISFFLIFLFLALRYNYGNDYSSYINLFLNTNNKDSIDYLDNTSHFESGWLFLCRLFEPLGFFVNRDYASEISLNAYNDKKIKKNTNIALSQLDIYRSIIEND